MPKNAPSASMNSMLPKLAGELDAPLLSEPAALGDVVLLTSAAGVLGSVVGMTLVIDGLIEPLRPVPAATTVLLVVVTFATAVAVTARCEYEDDVHAAKEDESVHVVSSVTEPDGVAVGTVA
jgi:hypothetical protein